MKVSALRTVINDTNSPRSFPPAPRAVRRITSRHQFSAPLAYEGCSFCTVFKAIVGRLVPGSRGQGQRLTPFERPLDRLWWKDAYIGGENLRVLDVDG